MCNDIFVKILRTKVGNVDADIAAQHCQLCFDNFVLIHAFRPPRAQPPVQQQAQTLSEPPKQPQSQEAQPQAQIAPVSVARTNFKRPIKLPVTNNVQENNARISGGHISSAIVSTSVQEVTIRGPLISTSSRSSLSLADIYPVMGASGSFPIEIGVDDFVDTPERERWIKAEKA